MKHFNKKYFLKSGESLPVVESLWIVFSFIVGTTVGWPVGWPVGCVVGLLVGWVVGWDDGRGVG